MFYLSRNRYFTYSNFLELLSLVLGRVGWLIFTSGCFLHINRLAKIQSSKSYLSSLTVSCFCVSSDSEFSFFSSLSEVGILRIIVLGSFGLASSSLFSFSSLLSLFLNLALSSGNREIGFDSNGCGLVLFTELFLKPKFRREFNASYLRLYSTICGWKTDFDLLLLKSLGDFEVGL